MIEYIRQHKGDIQTHHQDPICWWKKKNNTLHASVQYALDKKALTGIELDSNTLFPKPIRRKDVIKYYKQDIYRGFIATMLWGRTRWLKSIVDIPKGTIELKLVDVKNKLIKGDIRDAFISMYSGINKIKGVDWAFFTKVLFFMGKAFAPKRKPIPLILDGHMMYIHCALLIDDNEAVEKYYKWYVDNKSGKEGVGWSHSDAKFKSEAYLDFINRMHTISSNECYSADKLEEYLFDTIPVTPGSDIYNKVKKLLINTNKSNSRKIDNNNPVISQTNNPHITQGNALFPLSKDSNVIIESFKPFYGLTKRIYHDEFVVGYIIPLKEADTGDEKKFMLFVARHKKGYFCQIRFCYDEVDILNYRPFCKITQNNDDVKWERSSNALPTFKSVFFDEDKNGKKNALCLMRDVLNEICAPTEMIETIQNLIVQSE